MKIIETDFLKSNFLTAFRVILRYLRYLRYLALYRLNISVPPIFIFMNTIPIDTT